MHHVRVLLADETTFLEITWTLLGLLTIPALVVLNGFFVAAEFSLVAVRRTRIEELIARGITRARSILTAVDQLNRTIAATQLGITLSSIALGWVSESVLAIDLESAFRGLPAPWDVVARHSVATAIAFVGITFVHVVFGELIPKALALQSPDRIALWLAPPLNLFTRLTRPIIILMSGTAALILRLMGFRAEPESHLHSVEELALLIEDTEEAGLIAPEQAELVQNVFELGNKLVRDIMVPRDKMGALELTMPPEKVLEAVRQGAHTRMPVYQGDLDNIVGIVNTKNLFFLFSLRGGGVQEEAI
jgi:CBS domain containing-hemolysin-like protein